MRATLQTIHNNILTNLNTITTSMNRINTRISSGREMSKLSDNPVNLVGALGLRSNLAEMGQYRKNLLYGDTFIRGSEGALTGIKDLVIRAKVLATQAVNAPLTAANRANMAEEVRHLFEQALTLANTQVGGKFIFGGYRTTGYNTAEPAPFLAGKVDGYRINSGAPLAIGGSLTATVDNNGIAAGDLRVNGNAVGAINAGGITNGLNMEKAFNAKTAIEAADPTVSVRLTTLYSSGVPVTGDAGGDGLDTSISFDLNGVPIAVSIPDGTPAAGVAQALVEAINSVSEQTGVSAEVGDGLTNGGGLNEVVFRNLRPGDDSAIIVSNYAPAGEAASGFGNFNEAASLTRNTGQISLSAVSTFELSSPNHPDDTILAALGLDGGGLGFADRPGDGVLVYGPRLAADALKINGQSVPAPAPDGLSDRYADASAAAKAKAINDLADLTGVTAIITPALRQGSGAVEAGIMSSGDLLINGIDVFDTATQISTQDSDNALLDAINAKRGETGVVATRDSNGRLILAAIDGRNLHLQTSALGESITHLNLESSATDRDRVYFGSIQLRSTDKFLLQSDTAGPYEPALMALGFEGGTPNSGQPGDEAGDGKIWVTGIEAQEGNVRYAGDRQNNLEIKVGQRSTLAIGKNGQEAVMANGLFSVLKGFENSLRGQKFTHATSTHTATNTMAALNSGATGLALADQINQGKFSITVSDHAHSPPRDFSMEIRVDPEVDTLQGIAAKLNGVPGVIARWESGKLEIGTDDRERYTLSLHDDSSNFLKAVGITSEDFQVFSLQGMISSLDQLMQQLTSQISDFGARSNRIAAQNQILANLELATSENLSEKQDTDIVRALMEFKGKEVAYQAALSAAAKTMQLSLVNYL